MWAVISVRLAVGAGLLPIVLAPVAIGRPFYFPTFTPTSAEIAPATIPIPVRLLSVVLLRQHRQRGMLAIESAMNRRTVRLGPPPMALPDAVRIVVQAFLQHDVSQIIGQRPHQARLGRTLQMLLRASVLKVWGAVWETGGIVGSPAARCSGSAGRLTARIIESQSCSALSRQLIQL